VEIEYETEIGNSIKISETIKNVYTKNGEEFMLLANGESVRLDKILSVDGVIRANFGGGKSCGIG
jgi:Rho-binding antiterminator